MNVNETLPSCLLSSVGRRPYHAQPLFLLPLPSNAVGNSTLEMHFIDLGHADSTLLVCDGHAALIDGGYVVDANTVYAYLDKFKIEKLDYLIATHLDDAHLGGLPAALSLANVDLALAPAVRTESSAWQTYVQKLSNTPLMHPEPGDHFALGAATIEILPSLEANADAMTLTIRITHGEVSVLILDDADRQMNEAYDQQDRDLAATILRTGHHGCLASTPTALLNAIGLQFAVISTGAGNLFGHPGEVTLANLRDAGIITFRTDMQGTIVATSDGRTCRFKTEFETSISTVDAVTASGHYTRPTAGQSVILLLLETEATQQETAAAAAPIPQGADYILNRNTKKFHDPYCHSVNQMKESNKIFYTGTRDEIINMGYSPCGNCRP